MSLSLCCHLLVSTPTGFVNAIPQATLRLGRWRDGKYTRDHVTDIYRHNLLSLRHGLQRVISHGYRSFRFPSGIFALFDQVPRDWWDNEYTIKSLKDLGQIVMTSGIRVTFHPGQFCSLSSRSPVVHENSVREINHHAWIFDQMCLPVSPYYAINVHGGMRGESKSLIHAINANTNTMPHRRLSPGARGRLTLENDENCYSVADLLDVSRQTGVPIVWDSHHHTLNPDGLDDLDAAHATMATWASVKPLQHISNSIPGIPLSASIQKRRAHSDFIYQVPDIQLALIKDDVVDVDVEAKMKNLAIDRMKVEFDIF